MINPFRGVFAQEMHNFLLLLQDAGRSHTHYEGTFKSLDAYLMKNDMQKKALSEQLISDYLSTLTCKPQSKNQRIGHLRQFARYLAAFEISAYEPEFMRTSTDFTAYTFTDEEFAAIIMAADNLAAIKSSVNSTSYVFPILLRILYGCGLRLGEALALRWGDFDFERDIIVIHNGKNRKQRLVPMSASLSDVLQQYYIRQMADNPNADLLFESNRKHGEPYLDWTFRDWFLTILEIAGIAIHRKNKFDRSVSPHTLRHYFTYKSFLKSEAAGRSLEESAPFLSAMLGHESLIETEKYLTTDYTFYEGSQKRMNESIGGLFPEVSFE